MSDDDLRDELAKHELNELAQKAARERESLRQVAEQRTGAQLGRYRLSSLIVVHHFPIYAAVDLEAGDQVAVRVYAPVEGTTPHALERALRRAGLASLVHHPNALRVRELNATHQPPYMVSDLLRGRSLEEHLRIEGRLDPEAGLRLARCVCAALEAAHQVQVVHQHLTAGHVMLTDSPGVVVLGFGGVEPEYDTRAMSLTCGPDHGTIVGIPLATDQQALRNPRQQDRQADLYALGLILYQAVCGRHPLYADGRVPTLADLWGKDSVHFRVPAPRSVVPELSLACERVLGGLLEPDRARRYTSAAQVLADLEAAARGELPAWPPAGPWVEPPPEPKPRGWGAALRRFFRGESG